MTVLQNGNAYRKMLFGLGPVSKAYTPWSRDEDALHGRGRQGADHVAR